MLPEGQQTHALSAGETQKIRDICVSAVRGAALLDRKIKLLVSQNKHLFDAVFYLFFLLLTLEGSASRGPALLSNPFLH